MQCLQYQTDQQSDMKKVEKLNNLFFGFMAKGIEESDGGLCFISMAVLCGSLFVNSRNKSHRPATQCSVFQSAEGGVTIADKPACTK